MQIRDIMTRNVEYIDPNTTILQAAAKMRDLDIGALPIGENDRLVGMITDRDITVRGIAQGKDPGKTPVRESMTGGVVFCFEDQDIKDAAKLMEKKKIRRLIVLNRNKRMVGICSLGDLVVDSKDRKLGGEVLEFVSQPVHSGH